MRKPKQLGNVLDMTGALARARQATEYQKAIDTYDDRQAEQRRSERILRAAPRIPDEDVERIVKGTADRTKALNIVRVYLERGTTCMLCLGGATGRGKTFAMAWAIGERGGAYLSAQDLARLANGSWSDRQLLEQKLSAGLLCVDDLGTERNPDDIQALLLDLVDRRQGRRWTTLYATNLPTDPRTDGNGVTPRDALRTRYPDPRLWSRLDRHWTYVVASGPDLRLVRGGES